VRGAPRGGAGAAGDSTAPGRRAREGRRSHGEFRGPRPVSGGRRRGRTMTMRRRRRRPGCLRRGRRPSLTRGSAGRRQESGRPGRPLLMRARPRPGPQTSRPSLGRRRRRCRFRRLRPRRRPQGRRRRRPPPRPVRPPLPSVRPSPLPPPPRTAHQWPTPPLPVFPVRSLRLSRRSRTIAPRPFSRGFFRRRGRRPRFRRSAQPPPAAFPNPFRPSTRPVTHRSTTPRPPTLLCPIGPPRWGRVGGWGMGRTWRTEARAAERGRERLQGLAVAAWISREHRRRPLARGPRPRVGILARREEGE